MAQVIPADKKWWGGGRSPFNVEYGKLMMWYFLMSDAFTFGAFLISYGTIRFSSNGWPDPNEVFRTFPGVQGEMPIPLAFVSLMTFILIMSSVIMYRQMKFITTKDLGYNKEQVLVVPTQTGYNNEANKTVERFRARLQQEPTVVSVAGTGLSFNQGYSRYG